MFSDKSLINSHAVDGETNWPFYLIAFLVTFLFVSWSAINFFVSGMRFGIIANAVMLMSLAYAFHKSRAEALILFYLLNILIGPFIFVDMSFAGLNYISRFDMFVTYVISIILLRSRDFMEIITKKSNLLLVFLLSFIGVIDLLLEFNLDKIDKYYGTMSYIVQAVVITYLFKKIYHARINLPAAIPRIMLLFLFLHLAISFIQLFIPIPIRSNYEYSSMFISGIEVRRPSGLLGTAFVYGPVTLMLFLYCYIVVSEYWKIILRKLLPLIVIICSISSRTVALGTVCYCFLLLFSRSNKIIKFILVTVFTLSVALTFVFALSGLLMLGDQSNNTKILLTYLTIQEYLFNSSFYQKVFGHGLDSSSYIANQIPEFLGSLFLNVSYDNRIDNEDQFLIHNVYLQILYEFGIVLFAVYIYPIIKSFKIVINTNKAKMINYIFVVIAVNYFLHNGLFHPFILISALLVQQFSIKKDIGVYI